MPEPVGDLAIVLHSHMPYVEGFGTYPFGEEWLFDAILRSYVPMLEVADRLTVTVTPVLADQLEAPGVAPRLRRFARELRLAGAELDARDVEPGLRPAGEDEAERYGRATAVIESLGDDLLALFREPARSGRIELLASAATHAVLPLVATEAGRRLQIELGVRSHRRRFGEPAGFWLPECAYEPGLERLLAMAGVACFCVDQTAHSSGLAALSPIATPAGPVAVPIDWEAIAWLWSLGGYPSDPAYADFHRRSMRADRGVRLVTLSEAIAEREAGERPLIPGSWGEGKDLRTWDSPAVADLAWAVRRLELRTLRALAADGLALEARERAVRELLALQASDWAFLDARRQAGDYPYQRATAHARALLDAIDSGAPPPDSRLRSLAPDLSLAPLLEP